VTITSYDRCACGECSPTRIMWNCGRCDYLARSATSETVPVLVGEDVRSATHEHTCPKCSESYWLDHETWSRMKGLWTDPLERERS
jgi:ribosomal protein S27AE